MSQEQPEQRLTHFDDQGGSRMVDVSGKPVTVRTARARGTVRLKPETVRLIRDRQITKGDVLEVARLAGIMAAKRTGELIPLCHPLSLDSVQLALGFADDRTVLIEACVKTSARTGVEMEALTAVAIAGLTVYDMCKAVDRTIEIGPIYLVEKTGGTRGDFRRDR